MDNNNNIEEKMVEEVSEEEKVEQPMEEELSNLEKKIKELEEKENINRVEKTILASLKQQLSQEKEDKGIEEELDDLKQSLEDLNNKDEKDEIDLMMIDEIKTEIAKINKYINEKNKVQEEPILMENGKYFPTMNRELYNACTMLETTGFKDFMYLYNMTEKQSPYVEVSKSNGIFKVLNTKGFFKSVQNAYFNQFKKPLIISKNIKIDADTGEIKTYFGKNGQEYPETINESAILEESLQKVHGVVFTMHKPPLSKFVNEYNARTFFNAKCEPIKIRRLKEKVKGKSKIKKITKETAIAGGYQHVYAYYFNLINPNDPKNIGKIRHGREFDDPMSLIFNRYAFTFQTGQKSYTYPVFCSEQGIGKGVHNESLINWLVGDELSGLSSNDALSEQFNAQMRTKLYVAINEVHVERKDWNKVSMRMKAMTDDKIEIRAMGTDRFSEELLASIEMYSNGQTPFKIELSDRRAIPLWGGQFLPDFAARLGYDDTTDFINQCKAEMENFVMDLLRLEVNEQMAKTGIIFNEFRKDIIKRTNSIIEVVVHAVKNREISEVKSVFEDVPEEKLKELIDHISHGFVTPTDCNLMGSELLDNYGIDILEQDKESGKQEKTPTQRKLFWDRNLGKLEEFNFTMIDGNRTPKKARKLKGFKQSEMEKCYNSYVKHTAHNSFDDLTLSNDYDFRAENLKDNKTETTQKSVLLDRIDDIE